MKMTELSASILAAVPTAHDDIREASTIAAALGLPTPQVATHLGNLRRKGLIDSMPGISGEASTWHRFDSAWYRNILATTDSDDWAEDCQDGPRDLADTADTLEAAEAAAPSSRQAQALTWEGPQGSTQRGDIAPAFHTDSPHHLNILAMQEADNETLWRAAELLRHAIGQTTGHNRRTRYEQRVRDYEILARKMDSDALATLAAAEETLAAPETAEVLARFDSQILRQAAEIEAAPVSPGQAAVEAAEVQNGQRRELKIATDRLDADAAEVEVARVEAWTEERVAWANSCGNARLCFVVTGRHVSATFRPSAWPVIVTRDDGTSPAMFYADGRPYGCGKHYESPWQAMAHLLRDNGVEVTGLEVAPGQGQAVAEFWEATAIADLENMAAEALPQAAQGKIAPRGAEVLDNGAEVLEAFPSPESGWPDARVLLCDTRGQGGHRFATWWQAWPGGGNTIWGHYFHDLAEARADAIRRAARMTTESDSAEAAEALRLAQAEAEHATAGAAMAREMTTKHPDDIGYRDESKIADEYATAAELVARVLGRYVSAAHATAQTGVEV